MADKTTKNPRRTLNNVAISFKKEGVFSLVIFCAYFEVRNYIKNHQSRPSNTRELLIPA